MTNEYNPDGKEIRFIDSHYKDLFHIPDGSCVQIHYPDEMVVKPCTFIDEYHTQIGYNVFHICQFAEIMERNGASYMPEPEIMGDEAAWKVGKDRILAVQTCEDGYDYTLLDENYNEIDGGQVDNPELSMLEVRRDILESFGLENVSTQESIKNLNTKTLMSSTSTRKKLIEKLMNEADTYGFDGFNLDFESLKAEAGPGREWAAARQGSARPDPWNCFTASWDFP